MPVPKRIPEIIDMLSKGEEVSFPGLGRLSLIDKPARKGRNPHTGEAVDIPAQKTVKFKMYPSFKKAINPHL